MDYKVTIVDVEPTAAALPDDVVTAIKDIKGLPKEANIPGFATKSRANTFLFKVRTYANREGWGVKGGVEQAGDGKTWSVKFMITNEKKNAPGK